MKKKNITTNNYHIEDIDIQACSVMDCTGLIPATPATEDELKNYEELYPYLAKTTQKSDSAQEKA